MPISLPVIQSAVAGLEPGLSLIRPGNSKLGPDIWAWSIPAIHACPGRTARCEAVCYADSGFYVMTNVKDSLQRNFEMSKRPGFAQWMTDQIADCDTKVFRIHVAGDFYSTRYLWDWVEVCAALPEITFFGWTRSWRLKEFTPLLHELAKLKNVQFWYSLDRETGYPDKLPKRVRTAYMLLDDEDEPLYKADLVFRDGDHQSGVVVKKVGGVFVCSAEQGIKHKETMTCTRCRVCFTPPR